jgi:hypothetical protein
MGERRAAGAEHDRGDCLRRTCLKWEANGELSAIDHASLMERLCEADPQACIHEQCDLSRGNASLEHSAT